METRAHALFVVKRTKVLQSRAKGAVMVSRGLVASKGASKVG